MNHKTDMREALQLCIDAMLHDGVPTDPYHPRRVALAAAENALASRPDAQESLASENVVKDSTPKVSQGLAQADERGAFLHAAINCPHEIDSNRVVLHYDDKQPGHNALAQLGDRLVRAAAPQAEAAQGVPVAWQVRRADGRIDGVPIQWENCTKELYEATLATGHYAGYENGPRCEVRALSVAAPSPDREQVGEASLDLAKTFKQWVRDHEAELNSREYSRIDRALDQFIMDLALRNASPSRECGEWQETKQRIEYLRGYGDGYHRARDDLSATSAPTLGEQEWPSERGEHNQCDGCTVDAPTTERGNHAMPDGGFMGCTKDRYAASVPTFGGNAMPSRDFPLTAAQAVDIWIENSKDPLQFAKAIFRIASVRSIPDDAPAVAQPLTDTLRGYFETIVKYLEADLPGLALNTAEKARALLTKERDGNEK